jgi:hypothetical protein
MAMIAPRRDDIRMNTLTMNALTFPRKARETVEDATSATGQPAGGQCGASQRVGNDRHGWATPALAWPSTMCLRTAGSATDDS